MKDIVQYFERIQSLIMVLSDVEVERYEEQVLSKNRGNLRIRLRFSDNSLLEISEAIHISEGTFTWLSYRYHYQRPDGSIIFRYDNTPHHPDVNTHPEHKHIGESVISANRPGIEDMLSEAKKHVK
ncbi:MAG: DUF6516 family protein [Nitrospirota bacterium]|nr:DUF6516 family protein [Nitrospirota bacterium]